MVTTPEDSEELRIKHSPLYFAYDVYSCSDLSLLSHLSRRGNKLDRRIQPSVQESLNLENSEREKGKRMGGEINDIFFIAV